MSCLSKSCLFCLTVWAVSSCYAESFLNLLSNPQFTQSKEILLDTTAGDRRDFPLDWDSNDFSRPNPNAVYLPDGGPDGLPAVALRGPTADGVEITQYGFRLKAGEKYLFHARLKLEDFHARTAFIALYDFCWVKDVKLFLGPAGDSGWFDVNYCFTAPESPNEQYGIGFHARDFSGEVRFADVSLSPLDENAAKGCRQTPCCVQPLLISVNMDLGALPCSRSALRLGYAVKLPFDDSAYEGVLSLRGRDYVSAFKGHFLLFELGEQAPGESEFSARLYEKGSGREIASCRNIPCRFIQSPEGNAVIGKRLNQQVSELLSARISSPEIRFCNPGDGWVYIGIKSGSRPVTASLNGKLISLRKHEDLQETMRRLPKGEAVLSLQGAEADGTIVIRAIPELFCYPIFRPNYIPSEPPCDEMFSRKYIFPSCNTFNKWGLPGGEAKTRILQAEGLQILNSIGYRVSQKDEGVEKLAGKITSMNSVDDGLTIDELSFIDTPSMAQPLTEAMWHTSLNQEKYPSYLWLGWTNYCGLYPQSQQNLIAAACNMNSGKGKIILENYTQAQEDQAAAKQYLEHKFYDCTDFLNQIVPGINSRLIHCLSAYWMPSSLNHDVYPDVDVKCFLEMQMRMLAFAPQLQGLAGIGVYETSEIDPENTRWIFRLLRHYFVEGKSESLSQKYGFTYNTRYIRNPDFAEAEKGWTVSPAEIGSIDFQHRENFGKETQNRPAGIGDCFCLMRRSSLGPNSISQKAVNLTPGKYYVLKLYISDFATVTNRVSASDLLDFSISVADAEILRERSYVHAFKIPKGKKLPCLNMHKVVFKAGGTECTVTLRDWASAQSISGPVAQKLAINFVQLKPFFME